MSTDNKLTKLYDLLETTLQVQKRVLRDCYWRPTVLPETLSEVQELMNQLDEEIRNAPVQEG